MSYLNAKTLKKSRKLRKKSPKRKSSRKKSPKRKSSRKRRSTKQKSSRKRPKQKSSRKRPKQKSSRKKSVKRKTSRKRRSVKRKGNKKLKFRMITDTDRDKIEEEGLSCPICLVDLEDADNEDIVGCVGAKNIPGWTCCSKTKKTGGCKNSYFHKKCIETWVKRQESQHIPPSCPICRAEKPKKKQKRKRQLSQRQKLLGLAGLGLLGAGYQIGQGFMSVPNLEPCYDPGLGIPASSEGLPECNECNYVQTTRGGGVKSWHWPEGAPGGMCPSYFGDSHTNWDANMDAKAWRIQAGIPPRDG